MTYEIVYSDSECSSAKSPPTVQVTVPRAAKVVDVSKQAIIDYGNDYEFAANYKSYSWGHGFFLNLLNGTANSTGQKVEFPTVGY